MEHRARVLVMPAPAECGVPARQPGPAPAAAPPASTSDLIRQPAGMSGAQLGVPRERIAVYLLTEGAEGDLTPAKRGALDAHARQLAKLTDGFRRGRARLVAVEWPWTRLGRRRRTLTAAPCQPTRHHTLPETRAPDRRADGRHPRSVTPPPRGRERAAGGVRGGVVRAQPASALRDTSPRTAVARLGPRLR
jgi:hypothetical protein